MTMIGENVPRADAYEKVTGKAAYVAGLLQRRLLSEYSRHDPGKRN